MILEVTHYNIIQSNIIISYGLQDRAQFPPVPVTLLLAKDEVHKEWFVMEPFVDAKADREFPFTFRVMVKRRLILSIWIFTSFQYSSRLLGTCTIYLQSNFHIIP